MNGLLELVGSGFLMLNVKTAYRARAVQGVHWTPFIFFALWGGWNLYYYPHLGQWFSFAGGCLLVMANLMYVFVLLRFWKRGTDGRQ